MRVLILILFIFCIQEIKAQDTIVTINSDTIICKDVMIRARKAKFRFWNEDKKSKKTILLVNDLSIYSPKNGDIEIYNRPLNQKLEGLETFDLNEKYIKNKTCIQGVFDARDNYTDFKDPSTGALVCGIILGPIVGAIPSIIIASRAPIEADLGIEENPTSKYYKCYRNEAHRIKQRMVGKNFGIGILCFFAIWGSIIYIYAH